MLLFLKYHLKSEQLIPKQENTLLLTRMESHFCIVGSPFHEFVIIAFYDEEAGLVAVISQGNTSHLCLLVRHALKFISTSDVFLKSLSIGSKEYTNELKVLHVQIYSARLSKPFYVIEEELRITNKQIKANPNNVE